MGAPRPLQQPVPTAQHRPLRHYPVNAQDLMAEVRLDEHFSKYDNPDPSNIGCFAALNLDSMRVIFVFIALSVFSAKTVNNFHCRQHRYFGMRRSKHKLFLVCR
jgi:hypothetical protein